MRGGTACPGRRISVTPSHISKFPKKSPHCASEPAALNHDPRALPWPACAMLLTHARQESGWEQCHVRLLRKSPAGRNRQFTVRPGGPHDAARCRQQKAAPSLRTNRCRRGRCVICAMAAPETRRTALNRRTVHSVQSRLLSRSPCPRSWRCAGTTPTAHAATRDLLWRQFDIGVGRRQVIENI